MFGYLYSFRIIQWMFFFIKVNGNYINLLAVFVFISNPTHAAESPCNCYTILHNIHTVAILWIPFVWHLHYVILTPMEHKSMKLKKKVCGSVLGVLLYFVFELITLIVRSFTEDEKAEVNALQRDNSSFSATINGAAWGNTWLWHYRLSSEFFGCLLWDNLVHVQSSNRSSEGQKIMFHSSLLL